MASTFAIVGSVVVSAMAAVFGLYQARKADHSANTTKTIELGVKDLVDQYHEANADLRIEVHNCNEACDELRKEVHTLKRKVGQLETTIDDKEAEIIGYKRRLGELE